MSEYLRRASVSFDKVFEMGEPYFNAMDPVKWAEKNVVLSRSQSLISGGIDFSNAPYFKEPLNHTSESSKARFIAIMAAAQIGKSTSFIFPSMLYTMQNNPCPTWLSVGTANLVTTASNKLDMFIANSGLSELIKPSVQKKRNSKTGDTETKKEFLNGFFQISSANNHKDVRQESFKIGWIDDFDAVRSSSEKSGDTLAMISQRFSSFGNSAKMFFISSPELKEDSNIYAAYLLGDRRKFLVPCEKCGTFIELKWTYEEDGEKFGIYYELSTYGKLIESSVGYRCQHCGEVFNDKNKKEFLNAGYWNPTAEGETKYHYSYKISSLYAASHMKNWEGYIRDYLKACPPDGTTDVKKLQAFTNLVLGLPWQEDAVTLDASLISSNIRNYEAGIIPNSISNSDGNGDILALTIAFDLGGNLDDCRLDYEVVGWCSNHCSYSIEQGSLGSYSKKEKDKQDKNREILSYDLIASNSVWKKVDELVKKKYPIDNKNETMSVSLAIIDKGYESSISKGEGKMYIDSFFNSNLGIRNGLFWFGIKGDGTVLRSSYMSSADSYVKQAKSQGSHYPTYLMDSLYYKDDLSRRMSLSWQNKKEKQPSGFMNFPMPNGKMYQKETFFSDFESEHKITNKGRRIWVKKKDSLENHFLDCRVYNTAVLDIAIDFFDKKGLSLVEYRNLLSFIKNKNMEQEEFYNKVLLKTI